jgi:excisionase family DNA binding protein
MTLIEKKELLKVGDVAVRLGISIPHTYRLAKTGEIPCILIGPKAIRFDPVDVEGYVQAHRRGGAIPKDAA